MEKIAQKELDELIEQHELWLDTDECYGERLDLSSDLSNLDFSDRNLKKAYFFKCDLENANFSGSDLTNAWFYKCNNSETIITNENTMPKIRCPEHGEFIGYEKCRIYDDCDYESFIYYECVVKLLIPEDAKRTSGTRNKCRCNKAKVLGFYDLDGNEIELDEYEKVIANYNNYLFKYKLGEWTHFDFFNECRWEDDTYDIQFFLTFEEAVDD